ncbi:hypothetical protein [Arsenophonus apicola]|uniref:hypothetical protein n=1 Tax=Arsenophonus apicola TaxID=2879119 RepID=UPI00387A76BE
MAESLALRIKNSFSFNKPVITEQNCQQYFKKELLNCLKFIANNSKGNIKISVTFKIAAGKYCSFSTEGLETILTRKYTWHGVEKINKVNLQKFGCSLFDCIKEIKNSDKLDNIRLQIGGNIIDAIGLGVLSKNIDEQDFSYAKECTNKIDHMTDEDKINKEIRECFNKFIIISHVNDYAMKNKTKAAELTLVESRTEIAEETLKLCPEEVEKRKEIEQGGGVILNKVAKQSQQQVEIPDKSDLLRESNPSFWQKLRQKTTQLLATSRDFIKTKLIRLLLPTFFNSKVN